MRIALFITCFNDTLYPQTDAVHTSRRIDEQQRKGARTYAGGADRHTGHRSA